jgi:hypothetical protein
MLKIRDSIECATVPYVGAAVSLPCKAVFVKLRQNVDFETRCPIIAGYP